MRVAQQFSQLHRELWCTPVVGIVCPGSCLDQELPHIHIRRRCLDEKPKPGKSRRRADRFQVLGSVTSHGRRSGVWRGRVRTRCSSGPASLLPSPLPFPLPITTTPDVSEAHRQVPHASLRLAIGWMPSSSGLRRLHQHGGDIRGGIGVLLPGLTWQLQWDFLSISLVLQPAHGTCLLPTTNPAASPLVVFSCSVCAPVFLEQDDWRRFNCVGGLRDPAQDAPKHGCTSELVAHGNWRMGPRVGRGRID